MTYSMKMTVQLRSSLYVGTSYPLPLSYDKKNIMLAIDKYAYYIKLHSIIKQYTSI